MSRFYILNVFFYFANIFDFKNVVKVACGQKMTRRSTFETVTLSLRLTDLNRI